MSKILKKRIRKKQEVRNPTLASLKTRSNQINPIAFVACSGRVYVLRKLLVTESQAMPPLTTICEKEALCLVNMMDRYRVKPEERVLKAITSKDEFLEWERKNMFDSIFDVLKENARNIVTLYMVFKHRPYLYLPTPIAIVQEGAKTFMHKTRGVQPIHSWVVFTEEEVEEIEEDE